MAIHLIIDLSASEGREPTHRPVGRRLFTPDAGQAAA
jgi:hypothetical protein